MPNEKQESVLSRLRTQLESGHLNDDVSIVYRVQGGTHGERLDESVVLNAAGSVRVKVSDGLGRKRAGDARDELDREAVLELARTIVAGIDDLIPRSEARFVPDALVGTVSIGIGDEVEIYHFDADEDALVHRRSAMPSGVRSIVDSFDSLERRFLNSAGGGGEEER